MGHVPAGHGANLSRLHRRDGRRVPVQGDELNLVRLAVAVNVDDGADITRLQARVRQGEGENGPVLY